MPFHLLETRRPERGDQALEDVVRTQTRPEHPLQIQEELKRQRVTGHCPRRGTSGEVPGGVTHHPEGAPAPEHTSCAALQPQGAVGHCLVGSSQIRKAE